MELVFQLQLQDQQFLTLEVVELMVIVREALTVQLARVELVALEVELMLELQIEAVVEVEIEILLEVLEVQV